MNKDLTFKEGLDRLSEIVSILDDGVCELEDVVSIYEEGKDLMKLCQSKIDNAKTSIEKIEYACPKESEK